MIFRVPGTYIVVCCLLWFSGIILSACAQGELVTGDLAIIQGRIVDGSGEVSFLGDIVIEDGTIVWLGPAGQVKIEADTRINASGKIVAPGFIDIHAHGDPLETPDFENFLAMGVTSIAIGMDGSSIPLSGMKDWIGKMNQTSFGVNIIPFIGHGTLRSEAARGSRRALSPAQLKKLTGLLKEAMDEGFYGLSMGLEYLPGAYADKTELNSLAEVVGQYDRMITSHIRSEDDDQIEKSIREMKELNSLARIHISHIKVVYGRGKDRADEILKLLEDQERIVTADFYPYLASYTGIGIVFPEWAKSPKRYKEIRQQRGEELLEYLYQKVESRNGPEATLFGTGPYRGKTLAELADEYGLRYEVVLRDIIGPYGASAAFFVMDDELQRQLALSPNIMFASDGSPTMHHPRGYATFAKVIEEWVLRDSLLTIEEAVRKMTSLPAKTLGLGDRGILKIGAKADLVIFNPEDVQVNASFDNPHVLSQGMDAVLIDGKTVFSDQKVHARYGKLLLSE